MRITQVDKRPSLLFFCSWTLLHCVVPAGSPAGAAVPAEWQHPAGVQETAFELGADKGEFHAWGRGKDLRVFFHEFLQGMKLIVVTYCQSPQEQAEAYDRGSGRRLTGGRRPHHQRLPGSSVQTLQKSREFPRRFL